jgi:uncharacterized delta-60 repeat protein
MCGVNQNEYCIRSKDCDTTRPKRLSGVTPKGDNRVWIRMTRVDKMIFIGMLIGSSRLRRQLSVGSQLNNPGETLMSIKETFRGKALRASILPLTMFVAVTASNAQTTPGALDTTWGSSGIATTNIVGFNDVSRVVLVQRDNKIITAGYCSNSSSTHGFCVARYNNEATNAGTRDLQFNRLGNVPGTNSILPTEGAGVLRRVSAGQIQSDGKIVLAGECGQTDFCVARFNADGTADSSFNSTSNGVSPATPGYNIVSTNYSTPSNRPGLLYDTTLMAIQSDGRIVLATECGNTGSGSTCLIRFTAAGVVDPAFSGNARAAVAPSISPIGLTVLGDDKLLLVGTCSNTLCLTTFSTDGAAYDSKVVSLPTNANGFGFYGLAVRGDGRLLVGGSNGTNRFAAFLLNLDGTVDSSFGAAGAAFVDVPNVTYVSLPAVAVHADGRVVVAGACRGENGSGRFPCASRFTLDGRPDLSFGAPSYAYNTTQGENNRVGLALQADGKVVLSFQKSYPNTGPGTTDVADFTTIRVVGGATYSSCNTDVDGDGKHLATVDGLILARAMLGFSDANILNGIAIDQTNARRKDWPSIKRFLVEQCNLSAR